MISEKKTKLSINVLIDHLKTYKDAVIILGPDILENTERNEINEESYESYNRKLMIKEPNKFWKYYIENVMTPVSAVTKSSNQINKLLEMNLHSKIIDTNTIRTVMNDSKREDLVSPNGRNNILECVKCHETYEAEHMLDDLVNAQKPLKCKCGGNIKPTVLYHGERYNMNIYKAVKDAVFTEEKGKPILNTHTLIFIGVDFTDSLISELIDSYDALKDPQHYTVIITDKLSREDIIYYNPEFGVTDDIDAAVDRLIKILK